MTAMIRSTAIVPQLHIDNLSCRYECPHLFSGRRNKTPPAVDDVSFAVGAGETLALVGESGSGKSTIARTIAGLFPAAAGRLRYGGHDLTLPVERRAAELRRLIQIIFQNPDASLNRRHRIGSIIARPLRLFFGLSDADSRQEVASLLEAVRLPTDYAERFPSEISGGERQRVAIARALAARPSLLLCDEIVSALDVSAQATILELLRSIQTQTRLSMLFITHDLAVVRWFADRVAVLYRGHLCEVGPVERVFAPPYHPYTSLLLEAVPVFGRRREAAGDAASPAVTSSPPTTGCAFASQCRHRIDGLCRSAEPPWRQVAPGHAIRCHLEASDLNRITGRAATGARLQVAAAQKS